MFHLLKQFLALLVVHNREEILSRFKRRMIFSLNVLYPEPYKERILITLFVI